MKRLIIAGALACACAWTQTEMHGITGRGVITFSGAVSTAPFKSGTSLPSTCEPPQMFFKTDATAGSNMYGCTSTDTWTVMSGSGGTPISPCTVSGTSCTVTHNLGLSSPYMIPTGCKTNNGSAWVDYMPANYGASLSANSVTFNFSSAPATTTYCYVGIGSVSGGGGGGGGGTWGSITGTLSDQTDLNTALSGKQASDTQLTELSATPTDDNVALGSGTGWVYKALPDCDNATASKLLYDAATNAFSCGSDQSGSSGGSDSTTSPWTVSFSGGNIRAVNSSDVRIRQGDLYTTVSASTYDTALPSGSGLSMLCNDAGSFSVTAAGVTQCPGTVPIAQFEVASGAAVGGSIVSRWTGGEVAHKLVQGTGVTLTVSGGGKTITVSVP